MHGVIECVWVEVCGVARVEVGGVCMGGGMWGLHGWRGEVVAWVEVCVWVECVGFTWVEVQWRRKWGGSRGWSPPLLESTV